MFENKIHTQLKYKTDYFTVTKSGSPVFYVHSKNGLNATVVVFEKHAFVDVVLNEKIITRYCTPIVDEMPINDFIVSIIYSNILFKLSTYEMGLYIRNNFVLFGDFLSIPDNDSQRHESFSNHIKPVRRFEGVSFQDKYYPQMTFFRKKIVKNIFRYRVISIPLLESKEEAVLNTYLIGNLFFEVCQLSSFTTCIHNNDKYAKSKYGIESHLTETINYLKEHINIEKIILLRKKAGSYCYFKRENRTLSLVYLDGFSASYSKLKKNSYYDMFLNYIKKKENVKYYDKAMLVKYTYKNGKTTLKKSKLTIELACTQQMNVVENIVSGLNTTRLRYPSNAVLNRLAGFGLPTSLPLSYDDLLVLDMCEI